MRRFLAETDHRVLVFQNGFQWDPQQYLKKFEEIDPVLGQESSWSNFDERTFKANPFKFIKEYILCSVMFGDADPNAAEFTKNLFREFLGEGEELEIPTERESGIPPREKILDLAKQDPLKTASLIRNWLRDTR